MSSNFDTIQYFGYEETEYCAPNKYELTLSVNKHLNISDIENTFANLIKIILS
jgi:hypothetical protein